MSATAASTWFLAAARTVTLSAPVEVPLVYAADDPRPRVQVSVDGAPTLALLDPAGFTRVGRVAAARLGVPSGGDRAVFDVQLGAMRLDDLRAEVVDGDELVIGLGALDPVAFAIWPSRGVLRVVRAPEAGELLEGRVLSPVQRVDGRWAGWPESGVDLVVVPREAAAAWEEAAPRDGWPQSVEVRRAMAEAKGADDVAPEPVDGVSSPRGDGGRGWIADRQLSLAVARWEDGDEDGAIRAAVHAVRFGRDRCEPWVALGELLLRADRRGDELVLGVDPEAQDVLERGLALLEDWERQAPDRYGEDFDLKQPESCRRGRSLLDEVRGTGLPAATRALVEGRAVEASSTIRRSFDDDPVLDPWRLAVLGLADARAGRHLPAEAALRTLAARPDADRPELAEWGVRIAAALSPRDGGLSALPEGGWSWAAARATLTGEDLPDAAPYRASFPGRLDDPRAPSALVVALWEAQRAGDADAVAVLAGDLRRRFPRWALWEE